MVSLAVSGAMGCSAVRDGLAEYWEASPNPDLWSRAAEWEPDNAADSYRLGRYRQLDFEHGDLPLAISNYQRAVTLEPGTALYWLDLAGAYESQPDLVKA